MLLLTARLSVYKVAQGHAVFASAGLRDGGPAEAGEAATAPNGERLGEKTQQLVARGL